MMKSMFLADSRVLDMESTITTFNSHNNNSDNEFILVDRTPTSFGYDANDEEEYDYCDDAISEGMQYTLNHTCSFSLKEEEEMILEEEPSIQRILDEAHKSASEIVSISKQGQEEDQQLPGVLESSASDVSVQSQDKIPKSGSPENQMMECQESESVQLEQPPPEPSMEGRMSNKKRRKKMKLLKKAAAAAKAAAALASDIPQSANITSTPSIKSSAKMGMATNVAPIARYQNKRVTSRIAVACATETLACYKAELKATTTSKKIH